MMSVLYAIFSQENNRSQVYTNQNSNCGLHKVNLRFDKTEN